MSVKRLSLVAAAVLLASASSAAAQTVKMEFTGGRVTLVAQNAPLRVVLAEWARLGGTKIVNGEQVTGAPVTLELVDYPERKALDIVLRNVPGYIVSARPSPGAGGASAFDRVMILATTSAPRPATSATFGTPAPRPAAFESSSDDGPDFAAIQRANEQNRPSEVRVNGQPVVMQGNSTVVVGSGGVPQPFFPTPAPAPAPARPALNRPPQPANPFAPTPVAPPQPQDNRPPNTNER